MEYYRREDLRKILDACVEQYEIELGKPNEIIETFKSAEGSSSFINECRIYQQSRRLIIISKYWLYVIPFSKIIGYDIINPKQSSTPLISATTKIIKTDTGDMVKRAIIGGVVAGGIGAIIGAATAKKEIKEEMSKVDEYTNMLRRQLDSTPNIELVINVNDISSPTITVSFEDFKSKIRDITTTLNVIIRRNVENNNTDDIDVIKGYSNFTKTRKKLGINPIDPYEKFRIAEQQHQDEVKKENNNGIIAL